MKPIYASAFFLLAGLCAQAQLTESNHAPAVGDTYQTWNCDSVGPGPSGAGVVWNFSAVNTHSSILKVHVAAPPSGSTYAPANVAVGTSVSDVSYYKSSITELFYYGGNLPIPNYSVSINYTTSPAIYAAYPMSLNTTSSAVTGGSINVTVPTAISGAFTGNSTALADGSGTLILPGGVTYTNVLRVSVSQTINTTILIPVVVTQINYDYYAPGIKAPIFSIATVTFAPSFGSPTTQTLVTRNKNATGAPVDTTSVRKNELSKVVFSAFPNPSSTSVTLLCQTGDAKYALIFDVTGKVIDKVGFNDGKASLDVTTYKRGLYLYTIYSSSESRLGTGKITVSE